LTSILANLELLEDDLGSSRGPDDREAAAEAARSALRSSRRMRRLVGDLLLLARADAGRRSPRRAVDLAAVVRDAAAEVGPLASGHPISLDLPAGAATVQGVPDDLHRLVLNLLENALLHTPAGTPVVASVSESGEQVRLEVADRGPGVAPELRERVFERFARSGSSHGGARSGAGNAHGGSGLGLAIVRAVAEAHDGTVAVSEAEGGGALLAVVLPAATGDPAQVGHATPAPVPGEAPA
jgi:signal transduction histidine kinase